MSDKKPRIGFIGLGIMGAAMARNAARSGFPVTVFNRSRPALDRARADGLAVAESPAALSQAVDAIVVMVTGPDAVRDVLAGPAGIFTAGVSGKTLIQMSTIDEPSTKEFSVAAAKHGIRFLDCPVAGSKKQVEAAELILLAGADESLLAEWTPFLKSIGMAIVHAGGVGKGTALKLCMNLVVAQMTTALCESVVLAQAQGVDPAHIFEVISHSPALNCGYFRIKERAFLDDNFSPAFSLDNMLKDVRFMSEAAARAAIELPVTDAVKEVMERAAESGFGKDDLAGLIRVLRPAPGAARR